MKVYLVEKYETGEDAIMHIASTEKKAMEFVKNLKKEDRTYYYLSVTEVDMDGDYDKNQREVYKKEGW
jgi:hypothetical protein